MTAMSDLVGQLIGRGLVAREAVLGCTENEISALMTAQGVRALPDSYRDFLAVAGKQPYWLSRDGEWDQPWLLEAKQTAREIVEDEGRDFTPFDGAYILQTHQGYIFYYFRAEDLATADPRIWIYHEKKPETEGPWTFSEWIRALADDLPRVLETRRRLGIQT